MAWVVFLRAVNVGGTNRCQPAQIAKQLAKFGAVNIGAVGTFVVRENVSESTLRNAFAVQLAKTFGVKCEIMICPARDIVRLVISAKSRNSWVSLQRRVTGIQFSRSRRFSLKINRGCCRGVFVNPECFRD